ncbi:hypothetical protein CEXT_41881 [Caerostris extrusa]|uniref:Uncharacterized protein n=1 Tax=Caerostris extrusa TaxID=172846 RepID=A0AAV4M6E3_CAEEX|nr:hypothetical protein CEXT_41881 [Caerostris extrusa]
MLPTKEFIYSLASLSNVAFKWLLLKQSRRGKERFQTREERQEKSVCLPPTLEWPSEFTGLAFLHLCKWLRSPLENCKKWLSFPHI